MVFFPVAEDIEIPPTDYCLKVLPLFKFFLILQVLLVMGSLVAKDFWGALSLYFVVLLGLCCLPAERGINVTRCLYYAVMVIYCGVLNLVQSVIFFKKSEEPCCFKEGTPVSIMVAQLVRMVLPPVELISAYVSWSMFKDCSRSLERWDGGLPLLEGGNGAQGRLGRGGYYEALDDREQQREEGQGLGHRDGRAGEGGRHDVTRHLPGGDRQFHAFQGTGHKLGT